MLAVRVLGCMLGCMQGRVMLAVRARMHARMHARPCHAGRVCARMRRAAAAATYSTLATL